MSKLILQSRKFLEIGHTYQGIYDPWFTFRREQSVLVVGVSTAEAWIECLVSFGEERIWAEIYADLDPYFYEVLTD